jgi:hypothetical protein
MTINLCIGVARVPRLLQSVTLLVFVTYISAGCGTLPGVYLTELAHEVVSSQAYLHRVPDNMPVSPMPRQQALLTHQQSPEAGHTTSSTAHTPESAREVLTNESTSHSTESYSHRAPVGLPTLEVPEHIPPAPGGRPVRSTAQLPMSPLLSQMWADYRSFNYNAVIRRLDHANANGTMPQHERAAAYIIAGASAYILGNTQRATEYMQKAIAANPSIAPDPELFPRTICVLHQTVRSSTSGGTIR